MAARLPVQVRFIASMEACERFSYYGMLSILLVYLTARLQLTEPHAKELVHLFKMAVYLLPLAGAWLADRWLGRYRTILSLALFYCAGHAALALGEGQVAGTCVGLGLIAMGAGGIKPCVSAFVGDQFTADQEGLLRTVYGLFYWAINLGALFAFALVPLIRDRAGYRWAFAVPGIFMGLAAFFFRAGSARYVKKAPSRVPRGGLGRPAAEGAAAPGSGPGVPKEPAAGQAVWRIAVVLLPVAVFWALFDQINTTWVLQGKRMQPFEVLAYTVDAERMQLVSALLVLIWVPILTCWIYPLAERCGVGVTPLRRMGAGMVFAAASFVICAWLESRLELGASLSLRWQIVPYVVLELGEVLLSATGLEFAYAQAPRSQKSIVMSFWLLTNSIGNLLVAAMTNLNSQFVHARGVAEFLFYAGLMLVVAAMFAALARRYRSAAVP